MTPFSDTIAERAHRVATDVATQIAPMPSAMGIAAQLLGLVIIDGCLQGHEPPIALDTLLARAPASSWGRAARATLYALPHLTIENAFSEIRTLSPRFTSEFRIAV